MKRSLIAAIAAFMVIVAFSCRNNNGVTPINEEGLPDTIIAVTRLIEARPTDAGLYGIRAELFLQYRMPDRAMLDVDRAIDLNPGEASFYVTKADVFFARGKASESILWLGKAREVNPNDYKPLLKLGEVFLFLSDYKKSLLYLDSAAKLNDAIPDPWLIGGFAMLNANDTLNAIRYFNEVLKRDNVNHKANMQLAIIYTLRQNPLALEYYRNVLEKDPESAEAYYNMGKYYQDVEMYNEAIEAYITVTKLKNDMGFADNAYYNLGYIHIELKVWDVARDYFGYAIQANPSYFQAYYAKGYAHEMLGDLQNAKAYYDKAIDLNPNYEAAREAMHRVIGMLRTI